MTVTLAAGRESQRGIDPFLATHARHSLSGALVCRVDVAIDYRLSASFFPPFAFFAFLKALASYRGAISAARSLKEPPLLLNWGDARRASSEYYGIRLFT